MRRRVDELLAAVELEALRQSAETVEADYARNPAAYDWLLAEHRPDREFTPRELSSEVGTEPPVLSRHGLRLLLARTAGSDSWGQLECRLAQRSPELLAFMSAVRGCDAAGLSAALRSPQVQQEVDSPWFTFDSPAIVVVKQDLACVDALLAAGADIQARSAWWAGGFGVLDGAGAEQSEALLRRGARLDAAVAAELGWIDRLQEIVARDPASVRRPVGDGQVPLHRAASVAVVDLLLEHGAELDARCVDHESTPAQYRIGDHPEVSAHLVARGAEADLFLAAALGDERLIARRLRTHPDELHCRVGRAPYEGVGRDAGGHIYQWTLGFDVSPLDVARRCGHQQVFAELVGASPPPVALLAHAMAGNRESALRLIESSPGLVGSLPEADQALMAVAAWHGELEAVRLLLDLGFDPHARGAAASTPLDRAAFHGFHHIVQLLLERDPSPPLAERNAFGGTPLDACLHGLQASWRCEGDFPATVALLVDAGSEVDSARIPSGNEEVDAALRRAVG